MKRLLITGSCGMLGSEAMKYFSKYYKCYGTDILQCEYQADVVNYESIEKVFKKVKPHYVLHCAAMIDVNACEKYPLNAKLINDIGTGHVANLCKRFKSKMIYISTSMVFDGERQIAYNEMDYPKAKNNYALSKIFGEMAVNENLNKFLIVRTNIFGWKKNSFGEWLYSSIKQYKELKMYRNINFNSLYVKDFLKYLLPLFDKNGLYHLTSRDSMSKYDFAKLMMNKIKVNAKLKKVTYINKEVKRPLNAVLDCNKFMDETGLVLPVINETMNRFLDDVND